jgi:hypothetical protein
MQERMPIDYQDRKVDYKELLELIEKSNNNIQIAIKNICVDDGTLDKLESKFDDKLIYYINWSKTLVITNSITTKFVESHINEFLQCFTEFDSKAHEMMDILANTFNIDLSDTDQIWDLKRNKSEKQRGTINSSWDYHFHGAECAFINKKNGQHLDIKIIYGREYGVIDNFFLYRFIETTKSLTSQFELLNGESHNLRKVINVIKRNGFLINRPNHMFEELILNRPKMEITRPMPQRCFSLRESFFFYGKYS